MAETSITKNPYFGSAERPYTELFHLLQNAPQGLKSFQSGENRYGYICETEKLEAIEQHAGNSLEALLIGLQSLANVLNVAAYNEDPSLDSNDVANVGWLMREISNLAEACLSLKEEVSGELKQRYLIK